MPAILADSPAYRAAAAQHREAATLLSGEASSRQSLRALQAALKARAQRRACDVELGALQDALRPTPFCRAFEPAYVGRMLAAAERRDLREGTEVELAGETDGLYLLVTGSAEVASGRAQQLHVSILSARYPAGGSGASISDPHIVLAWGSKRIQAQLPTDAAGSPVFDNWATTILYGLGAPLELSLVEHGAPAQRDVLCAGRLAFAEFEEKAGFDGLVEMEPCEPQRASSGKRAPSALRVRVVWGEADSNLRRHSTGMDSVTTVDSEMPSMPTSPQDSYKGGSLSRAGSSTFRLVDGAPKIGGQALHPQLLVPPEARKASQPMTLKRLTMKITLGIRALHNMTPSMEDSASPRSGWSGRISKRSCGSCRLAPAAALAEPGPWRMPRHRFGPGQFFGAEEGGDVVRMLEDGVLLFVPRGRLREALREGRHEVGRELERFLRRHLPGGEGVDGRVLDSFAAAFRAERLPRGHVLCAAGVQATPEDHHRVYIIRSGSCRLLLPGQGARAAPAAARPSPPAATPPAATPPSATTPRGAPKGDKSPRHGRSPRAGSRRPAAGGPGPGPARRAPVRAAPVGLLGEGAVVGFASALFGVPEPFTVVPDEPVEVLCVSVADRPAALWPRDVVRALQEQLKAQTEWHCRRAQSLTAVAVASKGRPAAADAAPPAWSVAASPFLRHKPHLEAQMHQRVKHHFEAEGWLPGGAAAGGAAEAPRLGTSSSCPALPALPPSAAASPRGAAGGRGAATAPAPGDDAARAARAERRRREAERRRGPPQGPREPAHREEPQRHTLNLSCESDLRSLGASASGAALGKMCRQQVRKTAVG